MANKYFTTPRGTAGYPKLFKPDTKFNPEGVYKTNLTIDPEEAAPLIAQIEEIFVEEFGQKKLANMVRPYEETEDGLVFKFKSSNKPQLFDAKGTPIKPTVDPKIGSGTVLKIKGSIACRLVQGKYYATLYINAAQVIDLVEFGGMGFAAEEGSYQAQNDTTGDDEQRKAPEAGDDDTPPSEDF